MSNISANNKRIAKNTFYLYVRMIVLIIVNFYTTKVILENLGIDDFGLYNVVAGFVAMISFLNTSMTNSIQRFLNFEIGKGKDGNVNAYFETAILVQTLIIAFFFLIGETIGLWFINNKLVIPEDKIIAANVVYQFSLLVLFFRTIDVPFKAVIIAKEKMNFFAGISLVEAGFQLAIAFALSLLVIRRLEWYAILLFFTTVVVLGFNMVYSLRLVPGLKVRLRTTSDKLREVMSFSGWNLFGSASGVVKSQGINILMNLFFGVAVNAARGIAFQVLSCVQTFVANFQMAINPQIIQSYAKNDIVRYKFLALSSAKISFTLMWLLTLPILFCVKDLLELWLGDVPVLTDVFLQIILLTGLVDALGSSISVPIYATGKVRDYQVIVSFIIIMILPISYVAYKLGASAEIGMWISLCLSIVAQVVRVIIWCRLTKINSLDYIRAIVLPGGMILFLSFGITYMINEVIQPVCSNSFVFILLTSFYTVIINLSLIYFLMLNKNEKAFVGSRIQKIKHKYL